MKAYSPGHWLWINTVCRIYHFHSGWKDYKPTGREIAWSQRATCFFCDKELWRHTDDF